MGDVSNMIQTFGLAVTILIAVGFFAWRVIVWFKPWAEKVITAHLTLVAALTECQRRQESALEKVAESHSKQTDNLVKQTGLITELKEASVTSNQILAAFQCAGNSKPPTQLPQGKIT